MGMTPSPNDWPARAETIAREVLARHAEEVDRRARWPAEGRATRAAGATEPMVSTLYLVPRDAAGLTVSGPWNGLGLCGNASAPVRLADVTVPAADRLSGDGEGLAAMMSVVLPWFQLGASAVAV